MVRLWEPTVHCSSGQLGANPMKGWRPAVILLLALSVVVLWIQYGVSAYYYGIELPLIRWEVSRMSNASLQDVVDLSPPGEFSVYIVLAIPGKGLLILSEPTRSSFTGGGPIVIAGIGDCERSTNLIVTGGRSRYPDLSFHTVSELVENYDRVYQRITTNGYCFKWRK